MKCKNCSADIVEGKKFCEQCGTKIELESNIQANLKKCTKCGSNIENTKKFCENCGQPVYSEKMSDNTTSKTLVEQPSQFSNNPATNNVKSTKDKNTKVGIIIFICVVILAIIIAVGCVVANSVKNKVKGALNEGVNTLNQMGEVIESVGDTVKEEINKEKITTIEWKTPIIKTNGLDSYLNFYSNIENIENYDIYTAIVAVSSNDMFVSENKINTDDEKVIIKNKYYNTVGVQDKDIYYNHIYLIAEKGYDIDNLEIYVDNKKETAIKVSENNVKPVESGTATYGDCLTCTLDGTRVYLILTENDSRISGEGYYEDFRIASLNISVSYVIEELPKREGYFSDMFSLESNKEDVTVVDEEDKGKNSKEVFIDGTAYIHSGDDLCDETSFNIEYMLKENMFELDTIRKEINNKNFKLKFLNKIDFKF